MAIGARQIFLMEMEMINLEQMKADMEVGPEWFSEKEASILWDELSHPGFIKGRAAFSCRIARLPELEAAFLEAVETLQNIASGWGDVPGYNRPGSAAEGAILQDIARAFLERLK